MSVPGRRGTESKTAGLVAGPNLKLLDRVLRRWRTAMAAPYIPRGARVLDVGSNDGALFRHLARKISWGVGLDPALTRSARLDGYELVAGTFPADMPSHEPFDVITMLAVIEHIPSTQHEEI